MWNWQSDCLRAWHGYGRDVWLKWHMWHVSVCWEGRGMIKYGWSVYDRVNDTIDFDSSKLEEQQVHSVTYMHACKVWHA